MSKGIYLFWDNKYEQVIYAGRFTGKQRIKAHFNKSHKNKQPINTYIQEHPDRIESIIFCEFDDISNDDLNQLEKETIKLFKLNKCRYPDSFVFNFTDGGDGNSGRIPSKKTRRKMSKNHADVSGENHPMWGKKRPPETRKKIRENHADFSGENNPNYRYDIPSPQELFNEYNSSNITYKELAEKYNCGKSTIERRIKKAKDLYSKN